MTKNKYFQILPNLLPESDPRYQKWRESLKKRPPPWNKGHTKYTNPSLKKMSLTFQRKGIDNFKKWREEAKSKGLIKSDYPPLKKTRNLAFLIGLTLGDGNIAEYPRTERLVISLGTDKPKLINYSADIVEEVFEKKPVIVINNKSRAVRISIYEKFISKRLQIPSGSRRKKQVRLPSWIWSKEDCLLSCLRGLFEADGYLSVHLPTSTYNFAFVNKNQSLLSEVERGLKSLNLHPEVRPYAIRLRKKKEVKYFERLISFRKYDAG
jgi:hypothetical protein